MPKPSKPGKILKVAILLDTTTSWSRSLIEGILEYTRDHGPWHIQLQPSASSDEVWIPPNWQGDGVIARVSNARIARRLADIGKPVVNISYIKVEGADYPRVNTSALGIAKLAYQTLRSRGLRNFGYVGELDCEHVQVSMETFANVLAAAGHTLSRFNIKDSSLPLERWLHSLPKPVGVLCWGPCLGHEVIDACNLGGINVPNDVAVLGENFDKLLSNASYPPQAAIVNDTHQIGMTAAAILDGMMHGHQPERKEWMLEPLEVIERLSVDMMAVDDPRVAKAMRFLKAHALEPISVGDVLRANPMARRTLERKFRQTFGVSIVEQIRQVRINHARSLLANSDLPITEVAEKCGFSSYNYLNRIFKEVTGVSPSQYRADGGAKSFRSINFRTPQA
jgi:LacI family transcriptional regulator